VGVRKVMVKECKLGKKTRVHDRRRMFRERRIGGHQGLWGVL